MAQTIQQERAAFALQKVRDVVDNKQIVGAEFKSYASSIPAMIYMNGLGQAMAFCRSKSNKSRAYAALYDILGEWLHTHGPYTQHGDLMDGITQTDLHHYRLAQAEAVALFDWVKKFANAYVKD